MSQQTSVDKTVSQSTPLELIARCGSFSLALAVVWFYSNLQNELLLKTAQQITPFTVCVLNTAQNTTNTKKHKEKSCRHHYRQSPAKYWDNKKYISCTPNSHSHSKTYWRNISTLEWWGVFCSSRQRLINVSLPKKTRRNGTLYGMVFVHQAGMSPWQDPRQVHLVTQLTTYMLPKPPEVSLITGQELPRVRHYFLSTEGDMLKKD